MTTDSTSVLKDCRHPSLSSVHLSSSSSKPSGGAKIGRVVSLHRTNSSVPVQPSIRPRYLSEGHENSKDNLHSSKLFICTPTTATNDNVFHKTGSSLCVSMDFEFQGIVGLAAPAASIVVDNAAEGALEVKLLIWIVWEMVRTLCLKNRLKKSHLIFHFQFRWIDGKYIDSVFQHQMDKFTLSGVNKLNSTLKWDIFAYIFGNTVWRNSSTILDFLLTASGLWLGRRNWRVASESGFKGEER